MVVDESGAAPPERPTKRKPFTNFMRNTFARKHVFKSGDQQENKKTSNGLGGNMLKGKKNSKKNNSPYLRSGDPYPLQASHPSLGESARPPYDASYSSLPANNAQDRDGLGNGNGNRSIAPTLATNAETINSDAGHSRAPTTTTGVGALSSMDGAGAGSTFSSPNQSDHSLATTLTTIQSMSNNPGIVSGNHPHNNETQPMGTQFSHQYPVSPAPSTVTASAIPRHLHGDSGVPNTPSFAGANDMLLTDNASIKTLASSSKRRRSADTSASVRAMFGNSRESLPLSVLSGNVDAPRHSFQGIGSASAERASVYSSSGQIRDGVGSPALASERNSYYKQPNDARSLRSITNLNLKTERPDNASLKGHYPRSELDARSINAGDVASVRSMDVSKNMMDGVGHGRNGSIGSPVTTPSLLRQASTSDYTALSLSRRSSDWRGYDVDDDENDVDGMVKTQE